ERPPGGGGACAPPFSRVTSPPTSSSQWIALGASPVSTSTSLRSAVSCEDFHTYSAGCSGGYTSPTAAWIPPCAFAELHDCTASFATRPTRAPARSADTAA